MKQLSKNLINPINSWRKRFFSPANQPQRILFDHLPKCAGTTVRRYLKSCYPSKLVFETDNRWPDKSIKYFQSLPINLRHQYQLIIGHSTHFLGDYVHPDTIIATVLREPVDRIISHYFFVKQDKEHYLHEKVIQSNIQLREYVTLGLSFELENWYTHHFSGFSPEKVKAEPEKSLQSALEFIDTKYDLVGFQENLSAFMDKLKNMANLSPVFSNKFENQTINRESRLDISPAEKEIIAEVNFLDVQLYQKIKGLKLCPLEHE